MSAVGSQIGRFCVQGACLFSPESLASVVQLFLMDLLYTKGRWLRRHLGHGSGAADGSLVQLFLMDLLLTKEDGSVVTWVMV